MGFNPLPKGFVAIKPELDRLLRRFQTFFAKLSCTNWSRLSGQMGRYVDLDILLKNSGSSTSRKNVQNMQKDDCNYKCNICNPNQHCLVFSLFHVTFFVI